jgi:diketogulonate reductase-like aldo/keto reductase
LGTSNNESRKNLIENETILNIADKYSKKPAQILLKWAIQQDIGINLI